MRRYKNKHRFYLLSVRNKKPYIIGILLIFFVWGMISNYKKIDAPSGINKKVYDFFESGAKLLNGEKDISEGLGIFGYDTLLKYSSAMFYKTDKAKTVTANADITKKDDKTLAKAETKETKVITDRIKSDPLSIKNETSYEIDAKDLLAMERTYTSTGDKPKVLIVHTHACETYSDADGTGLGSVGTYRSRDTDINMVKIGEIIAENFKKSNISVLHDKTLCDYPAYNSSYVKSLGVIEWYLERYPSIEFVFDIHRDAIADEEGTAKKLVTDINGKTTAQAMIVCGTDAMGLSHPYWKDNLILALKIQKNTEDIAPGLMRPINLRKERFNMHKTKGSLLFEIGTHGNTLDEALSCAEYLSKGIISTIK